METDSGEEKKEERAKVRLPGEGRTLSVFAREIGENLRVGGWVFRRDGKAALIDRCSLEAVEVSADTFRTYAERKVVPVKVKVSRVAGEVIFTDVVYTMSKDQAQGVLASYDFLECLLEVRSVSEVPYPLGGGVGEVQEYGYDDVTGVFVV